MILGIEKARKMAYFRAFLALLSCRLSLAELRSATSCFEMQAKNLFQDSFELVYELRIPHTEEEKLLLQLGSMKGVHGVNVLAPQTKVA